MKIREFISLIVISTLIGFSYGCTNETSKTNNNETLDDNDGAKAVTKLLKFEGKLFSIPSPLQLSLMIKDSEMVFQNDLLNPSENSINYTTNFKKSINLGVYGANLGYLNIYEQYPDAAKYFTITKRLAQDLGIASFIDKDLIKRIEDNQSNKDSLMQITATLFRSADEFLMNNSRNDVAVLILAGGWIESLYFLTKAASATNSQKIINRIGEQKYPLDNLIEILRPYYSKQGEDFDNLLEDLADLATVFDGVTIEYKHNEPVVKPDKMLTIIKSSTTTIISDFQLKTITKQIETIRNSIIE